MLFKLFTGIYFLILSVTIISCTPKTPEPTEFSNRIVLREATPNADSSAITLRWTKLTDPAFQKYLIIRSQDPNFDPETGRFSTLIGTVNASDSTSFTDRSVPYGPSVRYAVLGLLSATGNVKVVSNILERTFPQRPFLYSVINNGPYDILYNPKNDHLYLFYRSGYIQEMNLQSQRRNSYTGARFNVMIFNNEYFLYFPHIDPTTGDLYVPTGFSYLLFRGGDLSKPQLIQNQSAVWSFASVGESVFMCDGTVRCLNCANTTGYPAGGNSRILAFRNAINPYNHIVDIPTNYFPTGAGLHYFRFSGEYVQGGGGQRDSRIDPRIFRIAPDGTYMLTSPDGTVLDYALARKGSLSPPNPANYRGVYGDFAFSTDSQFIFAAKSQTKTIEVFDRDLRLRRTIPVPGYPFRLFRRGNQLIVLCCTYPPSTDFHFPEDTVGTAFVVLLTE